MKQLSTLKHYHNFKNRGYIEMSLVDVVKKYQNELSNKGILVEYSLFFDESTKSQCKFVIDDCEELEALNEIVQKLIKQDRNAEIYVNTYSINFDGKNTHIYADTLWINSIISLEELYSFFNHSKNIEPCDIVSLTNNEAVDGDIEIVVLSRDNVVDYKSFIEKKQLAMIKSLYWD